MPYLIDGHNLIGQMDDLHLDDPDDEAKLVARLRTTCARERKRVTVVFDRGLPGGPSALSGGGVTVVFAPSGGSADGILRERIRSARDPRGLIVVTSDRAVADVARANGARVMGAAAFAAQLDPAPGEDKPEGTLSPKEVDAWMREFERD